LPCNARVRPQEKGINFTVNLFTNIVLLEAASLSDFINFIPNGLKKLAVKLADE